jgi:hypothetical protein
MVLKILSLVPRLKIVANAHKHISIVRLEDTAPEIPPLVSSRTLSVRARQHVPVELQGNTLLKAPIVFCKPISVGSCSQVFQ